LIASFSEGRRQQRNADTRRNPARVILVRAISNLDNVEVNIAVARRGRERQFILWV
jgi:hypothetical protein